ncbi:MAG TPA: right-handed parallel beta-helix repeat-containing protein, partial [Myxococcaceae bacterium]|nr:right-handed parallel beta-helix repeat-containing protein [Myxococcaceae bacterium]
DRLEVSWGFSTIDGGIEWTPWVLDKGYSSQLLAGQETVLLRARDEDGDVGYAARRVFVAADQSSVCTVTTARDEDDGALDCSGGPDGQLSLDEALRLAPVLKFQVVGFNIPGPAALTGSPLQITEPIRLAGSPNLTLQRELVIESQGKVRISGLKISGPAGKITINNGSKLDLSDSEFSDAEPIRATGAVSVRRTAFRNCQSQCIVLSGGDGSVQVSQSSFIGGPASSVGIELDQCPVLVTLEPAADLVGNVFAGFTTAVFVNAGCQRPTSIVHQTFHGNTVAIMYQGGMQHVLRNNVFSSHTEPVLGCGLFGGFASRKDNVVWDYTYADCLATDQGFVETDPKFASPDAGDFRLRWESPLIDTAPLIVVDGGVVDINGAAPDAYLGNGPDYGGRETY